MERVIEEEEANSAEDPADGYTGPNSFRPCLPPIMYIRHFARES